MVAVEGGREGRRRARVGICRQRVSVPWLGPHVHRFPRGCFHTSMPLHRLFLHLEFCAFSVPPLTWLAACPSSLQLWSSLFPGELEGCLLCSYHTVNAP